MSDQPLSAKAKPNIFMRGLLVVSLMINLLVAGIALGHVWEPFGQARRVGPTYVQLAPGKFFAQINQQRRRELNEGLRASRQDVQKLHVQAEENAQKIAAELEQDNYDPAKVEALVDSFTTGNESIAAGGGKVLKDFYSKLTPEERKQVANAIREAQKRNQPTEHRSWFKFWN